MTEENAITQNTVTPDLMVIGGGPGGYTAALRAAQLGLSVRVIEAGRPGGTCLHQGCIPTKTLLEGAHRWRLLKEMDEWGIHVDNPRLDYSRLVQKKQQVVDRLTQGLEYSLRTQKVSLLQGRARLVEPGNAGFTIHWVDPEGSERQGAAKTVLLATGSQESKPPIPGLDLPGVETSATALDISRLPESLIVLGAGVIGLEFASLFASLGTKVTVIEKLPRALAAADEELVKRLVSVLGRQGVKIITGAQVTRIASAEGEGAGESPGLTVFTRSVKDPPDKPETGYNAQKVLIATGRKPSLGGIDLSAFDGCELVGANGGIMVNEEQETPVPGLLSVGDVTGGLMLAHAAAHQGLRAAKRVARILGREAPHPLGHSPSHRTDLTELVPHNPLHNGNSLRWDVTPSCVYTWPELAWVGLTEAQGAGREICVGKAHFMANGRAHSLGETGGMVKIISEKAGGRILGVHILGPHAGELLAEAVLAITNGLTVRQLAATIHSHPTLSEALAEAAQACLAKGGDARV